MSQVDVIPILFRLVVAATFGGFIGLERQIQGQSAGFRTQLLVCLGACLFTILSVYTFQIYGKVADPARIAAQIVVGIGFLGAGAILRHGEYIRGLTTAATLWAVSGIGMAVGFGEYLIGGFATFIVLSNLIILKYVENKIPRDRYVNLSIEVVGIEDINFYSIAKKNNLDVVGRSFRFVMETNISHYAINIKYRKEENLDAFLNEIKKIETIKSLTIS